VAGPTPRPKTIAAIRLELGLDRSIPTVLRIRPAGSAAISVDHFEQVVGEELTMTIGPTVELMLEAMLIAVPSGLALGTLAAVNRGRLADRVIMVCSMAGVSMPVFFIGLILIQYGRFKLSRITTTSCPRGGRDACLRPNSPSSFFHCAARARSITLFLGGAGGASTLGARILRGRHRTRRAAGCRVRVAGDATCRRRMLHRVTAGLGRGRTAGSDPTQPIRFERKKNMSPHAENGGA
jgi:hypothetical protein